MRQDESEEKAPPSLTPPTTAVPVDFGKDSAECHRNTAALTTSPELAAYRVVKAAEANSGLGDLLDTPALLAELREQATRARAGTTAAQEAMLVNQAVALQSLFARLAERAMGNTEVTPFEANMRMALRAQSQCRATIETLALLRNPPVVYAKQANIANGPQQVNNGPAPARKSEIKPNELSHAHELLPDRRASSAASGAYPPAQNMGKIDGAAIAKRKGEGVSKRRQGRNAANASGHRQGA